MKKKRRKWLIGLATVTPIATMPFIAATATSCKTLHIHTFTSDWEYDETRHWKTCKVCHEHFEEGKHIYNELNDKCLVCGYQDPLVRDDGFGNVSGLTVHGKEKLVFNCPENVRTIKTGAFAGAAAKTVRINKECQSFCKDAFDDYDKVFITYEDPSVPWSEDPNDPNVMKKDPAVEKAEARIGDKYYEHLKDAMEAVGIGNTTVTILKDTIEWEGGINVNHPISLVAYGTKAKLRGEFDISAGGILYIPDTITYEGNAKLKLGDVEERRANTDSADDDNVYETVDNSGSLVFTNRSTRPTKVNVTYCTSFAGGTEYPAVGAHQVVNDLLVLPVDHYAWGTFRFNDKFKTIKGLTEYGKTVNGLTITQVVEGIPATIGKWAFNVTSHVHFHNPLKDMHIYFRWAKGMFFHLTIGKGITEIGHGAFDAMYDSDLGKEMVVSLAPIFSHLFDVTIGYDCKKINGCVFNDNVSLERVVVSDAVESNSKECQLNTIGGDSFKNSANLVSVDVSQAKLLNVIDKGAFNSCRNLSQVILSGSRWKIGDDDSSGFYFPYDFNPERAAYLLAHDSEKWKVHASADENPIWFSISPFGPGSGKDKNGWFNFVANSGAESGTTPQDVYNYLLQTQPAGQEMYVADTNKQVKTITIPNNTITKSISIVAGDDAKVVIQGENPSEPIKIANNNYLALSNVRLKSDIILMAATDEDDDGYHTPGGFAINPSFITDEDNFNVSFLKEGQAQENKVPAAANPINLRGRGYDAYGLCDFMLDTEKKEVTLFSIPQQNEPDAGLFRSAATVTIGHQTVTPVGENWKVILNGNTPNTQTMASDSRRGWMTRINLSDDVTKITGSFFSNHAGEEGKEHKGFEKLMEVSGGKSLTVIDTDAFRSSPALSSVALGDVDGAGSYWIHGNAFKDCKNLISVTLPKGLTIIHDNAFQNCKSLQSIEFPSTLERIGHNAFDGCKSLLYAKLPDENVLSEIGEEAFNGCSNLYSFYFGNNIEGWLVDQTAIPETVDLSDEEVAAECLRETYVENKWTKAA